MWRSRLVIIESTLMIMRVIEASNSEQGSDDGHGSVETDDGR